MSKDPSRHFEILNLAGTTALGQTSASSLYNFTVGRGEILVVLGGKDSSSLLRLLLGLGNVTSGDVRIDGDSLFGKQLSANQILNSRHKIGFAFRDKGLISNLSILDNVDLPAKYHGYYGKNSSLEKGALAVQALEDIGIQRDLWGVRPNRISGEIRKKVLLARSVVLNPSVLILDDPTAMAASPVVGTILKWVLQQKKKGTAVLIGTDDYPFGLSVADSVLHPVTGKKVSEYSDFMDAIWLESASILKNRIVATCS
jgi:ABC-type transporter Mla maintaining outer membrane lipid asymmetry ATPase subunit MlaF